jgi:hypothetical protein
MVDKRKREVLRGGVYGTFDKCRAGGHLYAHSAWYIWSTTTRMASSVNASKAASRKASAYLEILSKFSAKAKGVSV